MKFAELVVKKNRLIKGLLALATFIWAIVWIVDCIDGVGYILEVIEGLHASANPMTIAWGILFRLHSFLYTIALLILGLQLLCRMKMPLNGLDKKGKADKYVKAPFVFLLIGQIVRIICISHINRGALLRTSMTTCVLSMLAIMSVFFTSGELIGQRGSKSRKVAMLISQIAVAALSDIVLGAVGIVYVLCCVNPVEGFFAGKAKAPAEESQPAKKKPVANESVSQQAQFTFKKYLSEYEDSTGYAATDDIQAKLFARAVELQQLKSPASAQFGELEEMFVTELDENVYSVSGYVDAHNSYGAMVRTKFDLKVFKDEDGTWKNANKFVSTEASIAGTVVSHTILYWILGIIGTIITLAVSYFFMSQTLGF